MSSPLDQDRVTQIEVSIVCTKRWVSTRYVPNLGSHKKESKIRNASGIKQSNGPNQHDTHKKRS
jgi:hypothetical protein